MSRKAHSQSKTLPKPLFKPITDKISGKYKFGLAKNTFNTLKFNWRYYLLKDETRLITALWKQKYWDYNDC